MIRVLFFGKISDLIGQREMAVPYAENLTLFDLRDAVFKDLISSERVKTADIHMSLNQMKTRHDTPLNDHDEAAFFSLFSGG
jgi:molybdopterin converting factor small subunit